MSLVSRASSAASAASAPALTIGLDVGDRTTHVCELDAAATVVRETRIPTTPAGIQQHFAGRPRARVVLEVGTHSPWLARQLRAAGHEAIVANPSAMYGSRRVRGRRRRNDRLDAAFLARQGRADVALLHPITHRPAVAQSHLTLVRARDQLVRMRTQLINHVRGAVKSLGGRVRRCSARTFARQAGAELPTLVQPTLAPLLDTIQQLTDQIAAYDHQIQELATTHYPVTQRLQQVAGVGPLTALTFVLLVEDPHRFATSRAVGPYFGLVPQLDDSGTLTPHLGISKAGDPLGRRLLISAAQYILGPFGPPCDLRRYGEAIMAGGGPTGKKRAVVAVARKLAVLLHALWVREQPYDPEYRRALGSTGRPQPVTMPGPLPMV